MKIGVIIIFKNNYDAIDKDFIIHQINASKRIEFCLVDNDSEDNTIAQLNDIKEICTTKVSVLEIKKWPSEVTAKRAGARYMFNQFNLKHIGFLI